MSEKPDELPDIIYVFNAEGRTAFTSYHGDPAWDTAENRRRAYLFIEGAEAEVARLRAAFVDAENELDAKHAKLVEVADKLATERAAHEATKESLMQSRAEVGGLKARVAELEAIKPLLDSEALDQARVILNGWLGWRRGKVGREPLTADTRDWLRAHPEPATPDPEVRYMRGTSGAPVVNVPDPPWGREPATPAYQYPPGIAPGEGLGTPAATGVERCDLCGMKTPHDAERPLHHIGCGVGAPTRQEQGMPEWWVKIATAQAERTIAGDVWMPLVALKAALATQGLSLVTAADVPKPEERRVLEACRAMTLRKSKSTRPPFTESVKGYGGGQGVVDAEWARRAAKEAKGG